MIQGDHGPETRANQHLTSPDFLALYCSVLVRSSRGSKDRAKSAIKAALLVLRLVWFQLLRRCDFLAIV
jgi:hypothetical protein